MMRSPKSACAVSIAFGSWAWTWAPRAEQSLDQRNRRALPHVVGLGLEGETPDPDGPCPREPPNASSVFRSSTCFCRSFTALGRGRADRTGSPISLPGVDQRLHVLGEAGTAVAGAREQERLADPAVGADTLPDITARRRRPVSQNSAIWFMNEIRVASMALAAYLVTSAEGMSMKSIGFPVRTNGRVKLRHDLARLPRRPRPPRSGRAS